MVTNLPLKKYRGKQGRQMLHTILDLMKGKHFHVQDNYDSQYSLHVSGLTCWHTIKRSFCSMNNFMAWYSLLRGCLLITNMFTFWIGKISLFFSCGVHTNFTKMRQRHGSSEESLWHRAVRKKQFDTGSQWTHAVYVLVSFLPLYSVIFLLELFCL